MKVKDLIEQLKHCNPDAEVIAYNIDHYLDITVDIVEECDVLNEDNIRYTDGCSYAEDYIGRPVVYLY